jgi:hypothetical protein
MIFLNFTLRYVDVIHTTDTIGIEFSIGHADFYINVGKIQPGCKDNSTNFLRLG